MSWFSHERRDPCFGYCMASVACVSLIMEIALYCRSGARSGGSRSGNGAGNGGYRIRLERGRWSGFFARSAPCSARGSSCKQRMLNIAAQKFIFTLVKIAIGWGERAPYGSVPATESFRITNNSASLKFSFYGHSLQLAKLSLPMWAWFNSTGLF